LELNQLKKSYKFSKQERLSSKKQIDEVFINGRYQRFGSINIRYLTLQSPTRELPKILISVPKKKFRKAVVRNRIKRLIREAYRLNKEEFIQVTGEKYVSFQLAIIYSGSPKPTYEEVEKDILGIFRMLVNTIIV
jgi:ribonuclease P protein component